MPKEREGEEGEGEGERRKKVGHYVLGPCLGEGSFAKVRVGTHLISREKVAVKVVSKRLIIRREEARRNFRREALLLQHVRHPNVVCLLEAMETAHSYYLVFELAPNGHLLGYLTARKVLREGEARRFMRQIVSAVDHLHRSSIVHRDLKLENCLLNANWDIKIIDFGLSALCQWESGLHTQCGSPAYAAPEIFGNRRYGPAVDLWSSGVCLYAMVVGRLPFLPHPPTNLTQMHALILKGPVIPAFLSQGLQQLLTGLLEVQESRRLSINDLLNQSWLTCQHTQPITRFPPVSQAPPPSVDTQVVRYMSGVFRFSESDVIHSVTERKLNASSATYHLLKRHMEGEKSLEETGSERTKEEAGVSNRGISSEYGRTLVGRVLKQDMSRLLVTDSSARPSVSEYGRGVTKERLDVSRSAVSEYARPVTSTDSARSGCPVLRSHIQTPSSSTPLRSASDISGERRRRREKEEEGGGEGFAQDYKQCILYLKEARHAFALGGRALSHLHPHHPFLDRGGGGGAPTPNTRLPLLALHRPLLLPPPPPPPPPGGFHSNQSGQRSGGEGHQCQDSPRQQGASGSQDVIKLNVMGRPALVERGKGGGGCGGGGGGGGGVGEKGTAADPSVVVPSSGSQVSVTSESGKPPPPPPNTAHGVRMSIRAQTSLDVDPGSPRPSSSGSGGSQGSLKDPFSGDMWRMALQHDPRLGAENEAAADRKLKGVAFVPPLTSPKALTSRHISATSRQHNYFLVRQLTADLNRKRLIPPSKVTATPTVAPPPTAHNSPRLHHHPHHHPQQKPLPLHLPETVAPREEEEGEDKGSEGGSSGGEGGFGEALETERFLNPVIRVTITSTAKQDVVEGS